MSSDRTRLSRRGGFGRDFQTREQPIRLWSLDLGISLELGAWTLGASRRASFRFNAPTLQPFNFSSYHYHPAI
jgi:hypothetical protein